jgi:hypothetical protein
MATLEQASQSGASEKLGRLEGLGEAGRDRVTGFIVESEADAVAAVRQARHLDRGRIRETFEKRFSARRMAEAYVETYRMLSKAVFDVRYAGRTVRNFLASGPPPAGFATREGT